MGYCYISRSRRKIVANGVPEVTTEVLGAFCDAWNRHDVDALMSFMTEDCVFESSAGSEVCGSRYAGQHAVRAGYEDVFRTFPDAHWGGARHFVQGDRGVSEWTFTGTRTDGTRVEVHGCDLFTFRDGKIALKNSYRKNRPPKSDAASAVEEREREWMDAWCRDDRHAAAEILAEDFLLTSARGVFLTKSEWLAALEQFKCSAFEWLEIRVRTYGHVSVVNARTRQEATVSGSDWSGIFLLTDVWVHDGKQWRVVARHGTGPVR
jgi:steroid delta-isomerase-like uncharacterized protein